MGAQGDVSTTSRESLLWLLFLLAQPCHSRQLHLGTCCYGDCQRSTRRFCPPPPFTGFTSSRELKVRRVKNENVREMSGIRLSLRGWQAALPSWTHFCV